MGLKIGEIAKRSGVPASTIRYYVKEGLLPCPERINKKMAYYDEACIRKLEAIQHLQEKKYYPLSVIKNILRRMDDGFSLEESEEVENAVFSPMTGGEMDLVDRPEFLRLTGLTPGQLDEAEKIGLVMPYLREKKKVFYNQEDITIARDAVRQVYRYGLDPKDLEFYVRLAREITDRRGGAPQEDHQRHVRKGQCPDNHGPHPGSQSLPQLYLKEALPAEGPDPHPAEPRQD